MPEILAKKGRRDVIRVAKTAFVGYVSMRGQDEKAFARHIGYKGRKRKKKREEEERGDGIRRSGRADGRMMRKDSKSAWGA